MPVDEYVRVVSEADSPVQQTYVKSKDGAYVAAAIRKPKGDGPFPAIRFFHGAPGGARHGAEHGYHDFVLGPQGQQRPDLPNGEILLDGALDALDRAVAFVKAAKPDTR